MRKALRLWIVIFVIICIWIYFLFISPKIFNNKILVVPNIIEMSEEEGIETLKMSKIKYKIIYLENQDNIVLRTMPYPNTNIKGNYEIEVFIGKVMPASYKSFIGQVYDDVKDKINIICNNNGIKLKIKYEQNSNVLDGVIINESINNGQYLEGIEELTITISSNNTKLLMPNFVGKHINEVVEFANKNNLLVIFIYLETPILEDIILHQSIKENTVIDKNSNYKIEIYVSKGIG